MSVGGKGLENSTGLESADSYISLFLLIFLEKVAGVCYVFVLSGRFCSLNALFMFRILLLCCSFFLAKCSAIMFCVACSELC